jgi:hypothetical protein
MAGPWKPKLAMVTMDDRPVAHRPWLAVAEAHAEEAVKLFVSVMNDPNHSIKARLEAATKISQLAGATYRGEKKDGTGRPAANHHVTLSKSNPGKSHAELREALTSHLPPGSVKTSPAEVKKDEAVVILADGDHARKDIKRRTVHDSVGKLVIGDEIPRFPQKVRK